MCADTPPAIVLVLVVVVVLDASIAFALRARTVPGPFFRVDWSLSGETVSDVVSGGIW
jgi:hypothetical protein